MTTDQKSPEFFDELTTERSGVRLIETESGTSEKYWLPSLAMAGLELPGGPSVQLFRALEVLRHAQALFVHRAEIELRIAVILFDGLAVPEGGLLVIRSALRKPSFIALSERGFGRYVTLLCGLEKPLHRFGLVFIRPLPQAQMGAELGHGVDIAELGSRAVPHHRVGLVLIPAIPAIEHVGSDDLGVDHAGLAGFSRTN